MSENKIAITDFQTIGKTSDGKLVHRVTVDKLPTNIFHSDIIYENENGDGVIIGCNLKGQLVEKAIIEDAGWYNAMAEATKKMNKELSINSDLNEIQLGSNKSDKLATGVKIGTNALARIVGEMIGDKLISPIVGAVFGEMFASFIPNQKSERTKLFLEIYGNEVNYLGKDFLELKMKTEKYSDLLEDALNMASRALTNERREYISHFLKVSLTSDEIDHLGEKKLLSLLNQLNDSEIIMLKYATFDFGDNQEYYETHEAVLEPPDTHIQSEQSDWEKLALYKTYKRTLEDLGLIEHIYSDLRSDEYPKFDRESGRFTATFIQVSDLGKMLLRYIDKTYINEQTDG